MLSNYAELNEVHKDVLLELGNIGTGNAITALSQLTNHPIKMELPSIRIVDFDGLPELMGKTEAEAAGVVIKVHCDLECIVTFILNENFTKVIAKELTYEEMTDVHTMSEMQQSAICEIGNIMCNAYLNALASMLEANLEVSVPVLKTGNCSRILKNFMNDFENSGTEILFIENTFYYLNQEVVSYILLHPKFESLTKILDQLSY
ncbi:MAG: chemotaxis protein CheC [Lachnospiraceae bacterium]|nr:chemotaxis protein CheC [Lachnospiraceae bacterium]